MKFVAKCKKPSDPNFALRGAEGRGAGVGGCRKGLFVFALPVQNFSTSKLPCQHNAHIFQNNMPVVPRTRHNKLGTYRSGQSPFMLQRRRYNNGGTIKMAMAVADAPMRFRTTLKLGTESPINKAIRTITLRTNARFQVNSRKLSKNLILKVQ